MALNPLALNGAMVSANNIFQKPEPANVNNKQLPSVPETAPSTVTSISDTIDTAKESSLLFQLISRLLLSPEQDEQLSNSLEKTSATANPDAETTNLETVSEIPSDIQLNTSSGQFTLTIEMDVMQIQQQTLMVNNGSGEFIMQSTVVEAVSIRLEVSLVDEQAEKSDPLVIDVNGDGFTTTGIEQGAIFDINADGIQDQVSVTSGDDAFLALDINHNGFIDDGSELFGDQTGHENGFANLATYDDNHDGRIDANDQIFNSLLMMRLVDNQQFINKLSETEIESINLGYKNTSAETSAGDSIVQISDYQNSAGQTGRVADLLLQYKSGINK